MCPETSVGSYRSLNTINIIINIIEIDYKIYLVGARIGENKNTFLKFQKSKAL